VTATAARETLVETLGIGWKIRPGRYTITTELDDGSRVLAAQDLHAVDISRSGTLHVKHRC
jgi:hypothetical protein